MQRVRILLVGGGTGGHFYPLIAIAESLRKSSVNPELYYAGPEKYDEEALNATGISFVSIPAGKRRRYTSILNYLDMVKTGWGVLVAVFKLYILYPDVVVSKGGYTSVPLILAAAFLRIPIIIHESDTRMGSANRLAMRFARRVVVSYDELAETLRHPRVDVLGIPLREAMLKPPSPSAVESLGVDPNRPLIFVIGGSLGAERINGLILDALDELLETYSIVHQTGKEHYEATRLAAEKLIPDDRRTYYHPMPSLTPTAMNDAYHMAQIVISRAGSTSLYEIALHGKPSIIIPIPEEISHDQRTNAYAYARTGAAVVLEEKNMSDDLLRSEIGRIIENPELYAAMSGAARSFGRADAADRMSALIIDIAQEH